MEPMLLMEKRGKDIDKALDTGDIFELKYDGHRCIMSISSDCAQLTSRGGIDYTEAFPEFRQVYELFQKTCVLDGEIICLDRQILKPSFKLISSRAASMGFKAEMAGKVNPAIFIPFDILSYKDKPVTCLSLIDRRVLLDKVLRPLKTPLIQLVRQYTDGKALWSRVLREGLEGLVIKRKEAEYRQGQRVDAWIKIKNPSYVGC